MKPDWKDSPEWANWLAQDDDGSWFWFEAEPIVDDGSWVNFKQRYCAAGNGVGWRDSLERRP
jgi:hypothetical protein